MHGPVDIPPPNPSSGNGNVAWWRLLSRYHWFVLIVAALGWLFDTMDQQLFTLARVPAMRELLATQDKGEVAKYGGIATSIFLIGWAAGGLGFGVLGDRIGRAKTMLLTILLYSLCTGLSALSVGFWDFAFYRFVTGLGVGGEFAVGVALVAEVMPDKARPFALGLLQALSAVGNIGAALISMTLGQFETIGGIGSPWRAMFLVGALPALLALFIRRRLKEPERWQAQAEHHDPDVKFGSYQELFGDPRWRKNALVGLALAFSGVVGLWGIGFFTPDLIQNVLRKKFEAEGMSTAQVDASVSWWAGITMLMLNFGAFFGIYGFSYVTHFVGRRIAFAIAFAAAWATTILVFWNLRTFDQIFWMVPLMGFAQLSLFGGYAIYFPELFPTHLRSTGTSFCYNVGRFVAASGPTALGFLTSSVFTEAGGYEEPMRYAGVTMSAVFVIGLLALPFAPETKGQPLPE